MKSFLRLIIILISVIFFLTSSSVAYAEKDIKLAGNKFFPPYEYTNQFGIFKGLSVDIMNALTIESGIPIDLYPMSPDLSKHVLDKNLIQGILGVKYTAENRRKYLITDSYLTLKESIVVLSDTNNIATKEDLQGKRVAVSKEAASYSLLNGDSNINIASIEDPEEAIDRLLKYEVQAVILNKETVYFISQKLGAESRIKIVGEPLAEIKYGIAISKDRYDLYNKLDKALENIKENGIYEKIYVKWFGETLISPKLRWLKNILTIISIVLGIVTIISLLIIRWNYSLKKEVSRRTKQLKEMNLTLRQKQQEIKNEANFKDLILNNVTNAIIAIDKNQKIQLINKKSKKFFKEKKQVNIIGKPFFRTEIGKQIDKELINYCLLNKKEVKDLDIKYSIHHKEIYLDVILSPFIVNDQIDGIIIVISDITLDKKMREQMYRQGKLQALGQLVAGVAHELRNPLMAIQTFIQVLPDKYDNPNFRDRFITHITNEVERLNKLVHDLLNFGEPVSPKKELFSIKKLIHEIENIFKHKLTKKDILLVTHIECEMLYADSLMIKQVIINMLLNAIDSVVKSGIVKISSFIDDGNNKICIEDNGTGISEEDINMIFDPFFTKKAHGVGLGLSISHQFISDQGGKIEVESQMQKGTTFTIILPTNEKKGEHHETDTSY